MILSLRFVLFFIITAFGYQSFSGTVMPPSFTSSDLQQEVGEYNNQSDILRRDLKSEDVLRESSGLPPRFALPSTTFITPHSHGTWENLNEDTMVWRLKVNSKNATSINLGFTHFYLPQSAKLFMYSPDHSQVKGPFVGETYNSLQQFWSPVVLGDELVVELVVNKKEQKDVYMILGSVNHGYRGFGTKVQNSDRSGSCNVDVACEISEGWEDQIRSVAVISLGGSTFCTGFLVNNTSGDQRPLFMTAYHCRVRADNAASLVSYWNYQNTNCREPDSSSSGRPGNGSLDQFSSGATYRAGASDSDFTIVEFNEEIDPEFNVYFSGWDARTADPTSTTAIHHPSTDEKRISFDYDPSTTTTYLGDNVVEGGTHIKVADWDVGTTEPGSSGSPLFDQNQRIVGQLHGGYAACGNDRADWYGRISYSWNNGLKEVLDPGNTGEMFVDGNGGEVDYKVTATFNGFSDLAEDGAIMPGQTLNGSLTFRNKGQLEVSDLAVELTSNNPEVEVVLLDSVSSLEPGASISMAFEMRVSESIPCGSDIKVSYNFSYSDLQGLGNIEESVGRVVNTSVSQTLDMDIPDNNSAGISTSMELAGTGEMVSDLMVGLNISHSYIGDLTVTLTSPNGTTIKLHDASGAGADNIQGEYPTSLEPAQSLSILDGEPLDGQWTLKIVDEANQDRGTLEFFEIKNAGSLVCE